MVSTKHEVVRTSAGNFAMRGPNRGDELTPLGALQPEAPRPFQIAALQEVIGLRIREIAFASGVTEQTIRNWKKTDSADRPTRYDDLRAAAEWLLRQDVMSPKLIGAWFRSRNRGLGYTRPLEAIRVDGFAQVMDVAQAFAALSAPAAARSPGNTKRMRDEFLAEPDPAQELAELAASTDTTVKRAQ